MRANQNRFRSRVIKADIPLDNNQPPKEQLQKQPPTINPITSNAPDLPPAENGKTKTSPTVQSRSIPADTQSIEDQSIRTLECTSSDLASMIERAQDERFKLMRAIKAQMFGPNKSDKSKDPVFNDAKDSRSPHQKIEMVDNWVNRRLEQIREADDQIDKRIDQLTRLETSVQTLTQGLAKQLEQTGSSSEHAEKLRKMLWECTSEMLGEAREKLAGLTDPIDERLNAITRTKTELDKQLADIKKHIHEGVEPVHQQLKDALHQTGQRIGRLTKLFDDRVESGFESYRQKADDVANKAAQEIDGYLNRFNSAMKLVLEEKRKEIDSQFELQSKKLQQRHDDITRQLDQDAARHIKATHQRMSAAMDAADSQLTQRTQELKNKADQKTGEVIENAGRSLSEKYDQLLNEHTEKVGKSMTARREQLASQYSDMCQKMDEKLTDYGDKIGRQIARRTEQLQRQNDEIEQTFDMRCKQAITEKQESFEELFANCERTIEHQLRGIGSQARERVQDEVTALHAEFEQMTQTAIDNNRKQFDKRIDQINQQLEQRYDQVAEQVANMTTAQMLEMHEQFNAMVEQRKQTLADQLAAVRKEAEVSTELVQRQLTRRLDMIKPQAEAELEEVDRMFHQRVDLKLQSTRAEIEQVESQMTDMVETLEDRSRQAVRQSEQAIVEQKAKLNETMTEEIDALEKTMVDRMLQARRQVTDLSQQINTEIESICKRVSRLTGVQDIPIDAVAEAMQHIKTILTDVEPVTDHYEDKPVESRIMNGEQLLDKMKHVASKLHANSQSNDKNNSSQEKTETDKPHIEGPNVTIQSPDTPLAEAG